jgi:transposase
MAFREVSVVEIREVLRLWLRGEGYRSIERLSGVNRKTVHRYVAAAVEAGLCREDGEDRLDDGLVGVVCDKVRPARPSGHGSSWDALVPLEAQIKAWLEDGLTLVKVRELLCRRGVVVPYRTLNRFAGERCGFGKRQTTMRVADGEPGVECQVDFGKMGLIPDPVSGRRRLTYALIFTACWSRHCFVWLTASQATGAVIEGFEMAWTFFGGVFAVVIPDNMGAIVVRADAVEPRLNDAFLEYAQSRGFVVDAARVRRPRDKPRVERQVPYVRSSFFKGEEFVDLADAQRRAESWCLTTAGLRVHGTTQSRPLEAFRLEETPRLLAAPEQRYDLPRYANPKVHPDHHIEVDKALYSVPGDLIGHYVSVRADSKVVKVFHRGQLVKVHPRQRPGGRHTDPADLPAERSTYALRDIDHLKRMAAGHGPSVGVYAAVLLDGPLPWTKMRQVYRLLGLVKKWGADQVEAACARALTVEVVDVGLIGRMLERAGQPAVQPPQPAAGNVVAGRFARDPTEFNTARGAQS